VVVCDEGHKIKNAASKISKALKQIRTRRRVILTGTPLQNNLLEYWCMVDFVRPNFLGHQNEFKTMFDKPIKNGQCVDSTPDDIQVMKERAFVLHDTMKYFVQRRSHDVVKETLPPKREFIILCRFTHIQKELMEAFIGTAIDNPDIIGRMDGKRISILTLFANCTKIWNHPDIFYKVVREGIASQGQDLEEALSDDNEARNGIEMNKIANRMTDYSFAAPIVEGYRRELIENSYKTMLLFEIIRESIEVGDRLLVFSQSLLTLDLIEIFLESRDVPLTARRWRKDENYYRLDGSTPAKRRDLYIKQFNESEKVKLFLISTRAGGLGINLTGANRIVVMDANWNPCHDSQAACRIYRYGQQKPCFIYRLVCDNSLERKISNKQVCKQGMAKRVVDGHVIEGVFAWNEIQALLQNLRSIAEPPVKTYTENQVSHLNDPLLERICCDFGFAITAIPREYDSLLEDRKDQVLTDGEKRNAFVAFEDRKRNMFSQPIPTSPQTDFH
ncbi:unnamed protein product, partial [Medioppia subpectinata]